MTLGRRMNQVLSRMMTYQEGAVIDYTRIRVSHGEGGHGFHGERGGRPAGNSRPLAVEWAERFERMIEAAEADAASYERGDALKSFTAKAAPGLKTRIRDYAGRDPVWVAFMEGCSVELVLRVRRELGLNVSTGASGERPLTAPPRDTLDGARMAIGPDGDSGASSRVPRQAGSATRPAPQAAG